nr:hypothetical protein [Tanacetum cinerariifolium]
MNQNFYNSNSSGFKQIQPPQYPVIHHPLQETSVEISQARENLIKSIQTLLKKFDCIPFRERPMALLLAHERFSKIKQAFREKQHQPEIMQDLLRKLLNDLQILNGVLLERGEHAAQISTPSWKCPVFDDDDDKDEHLSTIPKTELDEVIKSSVKNLVPIPNESEGISNDTCDVSFCDNSPSLDVLNDHFELFSDFNNDYTSSDDDSFEDIDYVEASPPDSELVSLEEDSDSFFKKSDTSLSYSNNSLIEFETFIDHTEEMSSNSLPESEPDQGELTSVVMEDILAEPHVHVPNVLPTHPTFMLDSDFIPSDDSLGPNLEVSFPSGTRNKIFDPRIFFKVQSKRFLSRDTFSISFIRNLLCPLSETLLPFSIFLDFKDSRARSFVLRLLELQSLAYGIPIS